MSPPLNFPSPGQSQILQKDSGNTGPSRIVANRVSHEVDSVVEGSANLVGDAQMKELVLRKIQKLPPLPKTIVDIYEIKKSENPDTAALLRIIQTDPMIVASLLKISNSVIYASSREIKKLSDILNMLGYRMIINVAICSGISGHLKPDLSPYGISVEAYTQNSTLQSAVVEMWMDSKLSKIRSSLQLAAFLQEVGIIVLSKIAIEKELTSDLISALSNYEDQGAAEESVFGFSTAKVTSLVFSEWKFNQDIIDYIGNSDHPESSDPSTLVGSQALKVVKMLVPIGGTGITEESIERSREYAVKFGFDEAEFDKMIARIKSKLDR